ncbi:MAG: 3-phosphoshikimate 1-carboxyvinyltransferase [Kiloniellales bacterium]|nr:3-phosphoshikimate 1-carboxyvinyltransferase [Kiloniellales bacterium]
MAELTAHPSEGLQGTAAVPGDKSISHRALLLSGLAVGESRIEGLLEGEDVLRSAAAMRAMGAEIERGPEGVWHVWGRGLGGLVEPDDVLDLGNSGTGARLLMGVIAGHGIQAVLTGDASLRVRPMKRVAEPLERMGARILTREGGTMPLTVIGSADPLPIRYRLPVASAQVKSAVMLAGLSAPGETIVEEPAPTRDHTERMLRHFGAAVAVEDDSEDAVRRITLCGQPELTGGDIRVPADPSSAAFPLVAALVAPGSRVRLPRIGTNPLRTGLLTTLEEMGASIRYENRGEEGGETVADLVAEAGPLQGVEVPAERAPSMIDEYPILAVAAAVAEGRTVMRGLGELRVKESDRLAAVAQGLAACGVAVEEGPDFLVVEGAGGRPPGGGSIASRLDHRIAMAFLVLGLASEKPVTVDDSTPIDTSFPSFQSLMGELGAGLGGLQGR